MRHPIFIFLPFYFLTFLLLFTFVPMNAQINWKKFLVYFFVIAGLYLITKSFWMTLGIILLLFVIDYLLGEYDRRRQRREERDE